jgi:hypothetical protein
MAYPLPGMGKARAMNEHASKTTEQPKPVTPGVTKGMVRQHAYEMFRDKLPDHPLTLENWVIAEKDLVRSMESDGLSR